MLYVVHNILLVSLPCIFLLHATAKHLHVFERTGRDMQLEDER
jgi:hypothetical protein